MNYEAKRSNHEFKKNKSMSKKSIFTIAVTALVGGVILTRCDSPSKKVENAEHNVVQANSDLDKANQEYIADIEKCRTETAEKVTSNDKYIAELKAKAETVKKDLRTDYNKTIAELEQKNRDLKKKLDDYKPEGKEKWQLFKSDFNKSMDELGASIKDLFASKKG